MARTSADTAPDTSRVESLSLARQVESTASLHNLVPVPMPEGGLYEDVAEGLRYDIVGQGPAIDSIMEVLDKGPLGNPNKPRGSMLLLGPTGVGKTETVRALDRYLNPDESGLLRIDCSGFQQSHTIASLIGAPPGYVGHDQKPVLHPTNLTGEVPIILFDEVEKAHASLHRILLQILEEGELRLQNAKEVTNFRGSLVGLTSNVGAKEIARSLETHALGFAPNGGLHAGSKAALRAVVDRRLKEHFAPEFLNRLDAQIQFEPLDDDALVTVLDRYIEKQGEEFAAQGIYLHVSAELKRAVVESVTDRRQMGGRSVVKAFERIVLSKLGHCLSGGAIPPGSKVHAVLPDTVEGPQSGVAVGLYMEREPRVTLAPSTEIAIRAAGTVATTAALKQSARESARLLRAATASVSRTVMSAAVLMPELWQRTAPRLNSPSGPQGS